MPKQDKIKFRKQFTSPQTGKITSIFFGEMSPSDAARAKEYIERLIICRKFDTMPDETVVRWLDGLSDKRHDKLAKVGLVDSRIGTTLNEFVESYLAKLELGESTLAIYRQSADNLLHFFGKDCKLETVTKTDAVNYKIHLETEGRLDGKGGYGQNSVWKKLQHAKKFFDEMMFRKLIFENPFDRLTVPKVDDHARKLYVSEDYVLRAMEYAPTWEWKLIIALWRFGGLRRNEPLLLKWSDVLWDKRLIRVRSNKKKDERLVPIFPEIAGPLDECDARAAEGAEWLIDLACPKQYRTGARTGGMKGANLVTVFDDIVTKAGLPTIPMVGNNLRASAVKDLYSGKYPELRGRVDLIGQILGHSPQIALQYYQRFSTDDFGPLVESFGRIDTDFQKTSVKKRVKQEEKGAKSGQGFTQGQAKTPCFAALNAPQNKGLQPNYPRGIPRRLQLIKY